MVFLWYSYGISTVWYSIQWLGESAPRSVWGIHIPYIFPIQWAAVWSYLEFPIHLIVFLWYFYGTSRVIHWMHHILLYGYVTKIRQYIYICIYVYIYI